MTEQRWIWGAGLATIAGDGTQYEWLRELTRQHRVARPHRAADQIDERHRRKTAGERRSLNHQDRGARQNAHHRPQAGTTRHTENVRRHQRVAGFRFAAGVAERHPLHADAAEHGAARIVGESRRGFARFFSG